MHRVQKILALALVAVVGCGQSPTLLVDSGKLLPTDAPAAIKEHPEVGGETLVHGDFTPEEWTFATAPRPATNPRANRDTKTALQHHQDACAGPDGKWYCPSIPRPPVVMAAGSTSSPIIPTSWTVSAWAFDNSNASGCASNLNTCTSATCGASGVGPCATWGEIWVHRLGGGTPQLQQPTTFTQVSAQTLNVDPIFGTFQLANGAQAILKGTLTQVCTIAVNTATVTAQVRGGPGTRWQVSNACTGEVAKTLLQDTTQNTWSSVDSVGGGTATISQPIVNSTLTTVGIPTTTEGSMTTNDAFTVWSQPLSNLKAWRAVGVDVGVGGANTAACSAWVQDVEVADSSGTGASQLGIINETGTTVFSRVRFDTRVQAAAPVGRAGALYLLGDDYGAIIVTTTGEPVIYGGIARNGITTQSSFPSLDGDLVAHSSLSFNNTQVLAGCVFFDGTWVMQYGGTRQLVGTGTGGAAIVWGSGVVQLDPNSVWWNNTGTTFAATLLTSGALRLGTNTTGFTSPVCGTFTNNGVTQVDTTPAGGAHWPAGSTFAISLNTVGGTACGTGGPYLSAAVTADNLFTKAVTAGCNDVENYCSLPASVAITAANLDLYNGLQDINTGARFSNTQ